MKFRDDPVVIGAVGGSGTRVVARIARHAGFFMGLSLNESEDSRPFIDFYHAWVPLYLRRRGELSAEEYQVMSRAFEQTLEQHLRGLDDADLLWGAKDPRSMQILRFWHQRFPRMRFIHVVRNGLDMAFSGKQRGLQMHGHLVLNESERRKVPWARAMAYWSRVNLTAAAVEEQEFGERYLTVRLEELCAEPARVVRQIFEFLHVKDQARLKAAISEVYWPNSIGRWRHYPPRWVTEAMEVGREGMERFGYWRPEQWELLSKVSRAPRPAQWFFKHIGMRQLDAWRQ